MFTIVLIATHAIQEDNGGEVRKALGGLLIAILVFGGAPIPAQESQSAQPQLPEPQQKHDQAEPSAQQNIFHIKYVSESSVYLDAGKNAGLEEGMILHIAHADPNVVITESARFQSGDPVADLRIFSVADTSSAAEIIKSREDFAVGDIAFLDVQSIHAREDKVNAVESENYPVVVTFSYGDPLDEELRATKIEERNGPLQASNQIRGRIGFTLGYLTEAGGVSSRQTGLLIDANISRIGGTHWNFTGYWRGDLTSQHTGTSGFSNGVSPTTLSELLNRTYHLGLYYQNPDSIVTMGIGRLYVPYAPSLSTIDGGYFGYRIRPRFTIGVFGGSTPDPSSWSYAPNQHIAGTFINYSYGDFDHLRLDDTFGLATTSIGWHIGREFAFAENTISFSRAFSVYNSLQFDKARIVQTTPLVTTSYATGLTQSFSSIRYQPIRLITFDLNHNYLRNLPSFDPILISTGLLDQYLFQGLSGGVRLDLPYHIGVSTDVGKSKSSTDKSNSWNQMYGLTFGEIRKTGLQLDLRYSKFDSSFGRGQYEMVSVSRTIADRFHLQLQAGTQTLISPLSSNSHSTFVNSIVDFSLGPRYFFEGLYSWNTGTSMTYQQINFTFGYRFGGKLRK
jgi:hypothetical protein